MAGNPNRSGGEENENRKEENGGNGVGTYPHFNLPLFLLLDIFLKFPIMAVIQCKSVCKSWYNLISDPVFFINYSKKNPNFTTLMYFRPHSPAVRHDVFSLLQVSENGSYANTPIKFNVTDCKSEELCEFRVINSFNGFICLLHKNHFTETIHICNPFTGSYTALPGHKVDNSISLVDYKFGFVPSLRKFKVMRFSFRRLDEGTILEIVEIFSVGIDNGWRRLPSPNARYVVFGLDPIVGLHGAFHGIVEDEGSVSISTFDLEEEIVGPRIPVPPGLKNFESMYLAELNDCLCIGDLSDSSLLTLWKMKEYGAVESWSKEVIERSHFPWFLDFKNLDVLATLPNGGFLFAVEKRFPLFAYNPKEKACFQINVSRVRTALTVIPYEPIFASL